MLIPIAARATSRRMAKKKEEPEVQLHMRIPQSMSERLGDQAGIRDLSVAQLVRAAISEKLEKLEADASRADMHGN